VGKPGVGADKKAGKADEMEERIGPGIPVIGQKARPLLREGVPMGWKRVSVHKEGVPLDKEAVPIDRNPVPIGEDGIPIDEERVPIDDETVPIDGN
jgi:hypothetical protein